MVLSAGPNALLWGLVGPTVKDTIYDFGSGALTALKYYLAYNLTVVIIESVTQIIISW